MIVLSALQMQITRCLLPEKKHGVTDVIEGMEYEFRVSAINFSGSGEPSLPSDFVFARDPKSKYWQKNKMMHNFSVPQYQIF